MIGKTTLGTHLLEWLLWTNSAATCTETARVHGRMILKRWPG